MSNGIESDPYSLPPNKFLDELLADREPTIDPRYAVGRGPYDKVGSMAYMNARRALVMNTKIFKSAAVNTVDYPPKNC
jgi:hypothetical protein